MKHDNIEFLKSAEKGSSDIPGIIIVAILLAVVLSLFIASPGGENQPQRSTPITTTADGRHQVVRPERTQDPETAVFPTAVGAEDGQQPRQTTRPQQPANYTPPASPTPQATWTLQPTYTPYPTPTTPPTPLPSYTPLPTYTAAPTQTPLPTYTAAPTTEPTRPPLLAIAPAPPDNTQTYLLIGMAGSGVAFVIVSVLFITSLRNPNPIAIINARPPTPPPHQRILPAPTWPPIRETGLTGLTSSEPVRIPVQDTGSETITMRVEPVAGEADETLIRELWAIWQALPGQGKRQSINNVCFEKWGGKNPQRLALVRRAISWGEGQQQEQKKKRPLYIHTPKGTVQA